VIIVDKVKARYAHNSSVSIAINFLSVIQRIFAALAHYHCTSVM